MSIAAGYLVLITTVFLHFSGFYGFKIQKYISTLNAKSSTHCKAKKETSGDIRNILFYEHVR
jgi:hypothetical protein